MQFVAKKRLSGVYFVCKKGLYSFFLTYTPFLG